MPLMQLSNLRRSRRMVAVAAAASILGLAAAGPAIGASESLGDLRRATNAFHSISVAEKAGYGHFTDAAGIACIAMPGMGAMGVHYVNGALVGDPTINANQPEAMVYRPTPDGLKLAAVEYVVLADAWRQAGHTSPPSLFGHEFMFTGPKNRYGLPGFWSLHVWAWYHNPAGTFAMWNPNVSCGS